MSSSTASSETAKVQKDAQNSTQTGSFAELGIENTDIKAASGVELNEEQRVLVGSVLDVRCFPLPLVISLLFLSFSFHYPSPILPHSISYFKASPNSTPSQKPHEMNENELLIYISIISSSPAAPPSKNSHSGPTPPNSKTRSRKPRAGNNTKRSGTVSRPLSRKSSGCTTSSPVRETRLRWI